MRMVKRGEQAIKDLGARMRQVQGRTPACSTVTRTDKTMLLELRKRVHCSKGSSGLRTTISAPQRRSAATALAESFR